MSVMMADSRPHNLSTQRMESQVSVDACPGTPTTLDHYPSLSSRNLSMDARPGQRRNQGNTASNVQQSQGTAQPPGPSEMSSRVIEMNRIMQQATSSPARSYSTSGPPAMNQAHHVRGPDSNMYSPPVMDQTSSNRQTSGQPYIERGSSNSLPNMEDDLKSNARLAQAEILNAVCKSGESFSSESLSSVESCSSLESTDFELKLKQYEDKMPPHIRGGFYDVMILYSEDDYNEAEKFRQHLLTEIILSNGEPPSVVLYDCPELRSLSGSKLKHLEAALYRSTYVFVFMTEKFCKDTWMELSSEECLMKAIEDEEKRWCVVPVHTVSKRSATFKIPMGLNSLKGVHYYNNDQFYRNGVSRLIGDKVYVRKDNEKKHVAKQIKWLEERQRKEAEQVEMMLRIRLVEEEKTKEHLSKLSAETEQMFRNRDFLTQPDESGPYGTYMHHSSSQPCMTEGGNRLQHTSSNTSIHKMDKYSPIINQMVDQFRDVGLRREQSCPQSLHQGENFQNPRLNSLGMPGQFPLYGNQPGFDPPGNVAVPPPSHPSQGMLSRGSNFVNHQHTSYPNQGGDLAQPRQRLASQQSQPSADMGEQSHQVTSTGNMAHFYVQNNASPHNPTVVSHTMSQLPPSVQPDPQASEQFVSMNMASLQSGPATRTQEPQRMSEASYTSHVSSTHSSLSSSSSQPAAGAPNLGFFGERFASSSLTQGGYDSQPVSSTSHDESQIQPRSGPGNSSGQVYSIDGARSSHQGHQQSLQSEPGNGVPHLSILEGPVENDGDSHQHMSGMSSEPLLGLQADEMPSTIHKSAPPLSAVRTEGTEIIKEIHHHHHYHKSKNPHKVINIVNAQNVQLGDKNKMVEVQGGAITKTLERGPSDEEDDDEECEEKGESGEDTPDGGLDVQEEESLHVVGGPVGETTSKKLADASSKSCDVEVEKTQNLRMNLEVTGEMHDGNNGKRSNSSSPGSCSPSIDAASGAGPSQLLSGLTPSLQKIETSPEASMEVCRESANQPTASAVVNEFYHARPSTSVGVKPNSQLVGPQMKHIAGGVKSSAMTKPMARVPPTRSSQEKSSSVDSTDLKKVASTEETDLKRVVPSGQTAVQHVVTDSEQTAVKVLDDDSKHLQCINTGHVANISDNLNSQSILTSDGPSDSSEHVPLRISSNQIRQNQVNPAQYYNTKFSAGNMDYEDDLEVDAPSDTDPQRTTERFRSNSESVELGHDPLSRLQFEERYNAATSGAEAPSSPLGNDYYYVPHPSQQPYPDNSAGQQSGAPRSGNSSRRMQKTNQQSCVIS